MFSLLEDVADLPPLQVKAKARLDRAILRHLMDSGSWVRVEDLEDAIYGHRDDGGPLTSLPCIRTIICRDIRKHLRPGFYIEGAHFSGYRLVVDESAFLDRIQEALVA